MIERIEQLLRERRVLIISGLWLIGVLLTLPFRSYFPFDDTYITFRYAANLAHGLGLVWNPGGAHTEGFTNFLYVVLLAPFSAVGVDLMNAGQWLCLMSVLVTAFGISRIVRGTLRSHGATFGVFAALLYLADPFTWINALSALETSIFVMFVVLAFDQLARSKWRGMFLAATLATLTRPEGGLLVGVCLGAGLLGISGHDRLAGRTEQPRMLRDAVLYSFLPLAAYALWKLYYFGDLLPNSFHVKVSQNPFSMMNGGGTVKIYYGSMWIFAALSAIAFFAHRRHRAIQAMAAWCVLLSFFYTFSTLLQPQYDRFMMSFEACMIVFVAVGILNEADPLLRLRARWFPRFDLGVSRAKPILALGMMSFLLFFQSYHGWHGRGGHDLFLHDDRFDDRYIRIAKLFATIPHNSEITFAWGDAGMLPYYSGMKHIDIVGLNNNEIARAHTPGEVLDIIAKARPEIIILPTDLMDTSLHDSCHHVFRYAHGLIGRSYMKILSHPGLKDYVPVVTLPQSVYDLHVLVDSRSTHFTDIATTLSAAIGKKGLGRDTSVIVTAPACCFD